MIKLQLLSFIAIAAAICAVSASGGFILAGVLSAGKVDELYARLEKAEQGAATQAMIMASLAAALSNLFAKFEEQSEDRVDRAAIEHARSLLSAV